MLVLIIIISSYFFFKDKDMMAEADLCFYLNSI